MLSRVADNIYWMSRYLERAENTARLVNVHAHLLLDLPRKVALGWAPLINITGNARLFAELYTDDTERNVVRFLIGDSNNPGSIIASLRQARENVRTIRDFIPREAWEQINELFLATRSQLPTGLSTNRRYDYLRSIILGTEQIVGLLAGTMAHDDGYDFLRVGRHLERAEMTTRIVDVSSANLLPGQPEDLTPFENIQWMSVLKSMSGYQMYRRQTQGPVRRPDVLRFLFQDHQFPRAFYHCLGEVEMCLKRLPRHDAPLRHVVRLERMVAEAKPAKLSQQELHKFIDDLQLELATIHDHVAATYFVMTTPSDAGTERAASA